MILCDGGPITPEHLPPHFDRRSLVGAASSLPGPMTLEELEMQAIHTALERHEGSKPKAAEELGVSLKTLYNKLNRADATAKIA
jgi:DNA-binding NtrC family response regulator